ncbi:hypothetical protein EJ02DRAFT_468668 [Clathrospora elynae]|uniref:Uncharacterized protein n=1 Tax=Clathrospora elynae TaxID=706981 RepID=A0A6A5SGR0_9PLEO|nr:hypothetical protein EJ02DRAFT_468668 [Clathrospora elynae]
MTSAPPFIARYTRIHKNQKLLLSPVQLYMSLPTILYSTTLTWGELSSLWAAAAFTSTSTPSYQSKRQSINPFDPPPVDPRHSAAPGGYSTASRHAPHYHYLQPAQPDLLIACINAAGPSPTRATAVTAQLQILSGQHFHNFAAARNYLEETVWYPCSGTYGVPVTEVDKAYFSKKLCIVLAHASDIETIAHMMLASKVRLSVRQPDALIRPSSTFYHLRVPSLLHHSRSLLSVLRPHMILRVATKIHTQDIIGIAFQRSKSFRSLHTEDESFTFLQRIRFLAYLLAHVKLVADQVMSQQYLKKYAALPFTGLCQYKELTDG